MKRKALIAGIMAGVLSLVLLAGCGSSKTSVKDDLINYDKQCAQFVSDTKELQSLKDPKEMASKLDELATKIKAVDVKTSEVQDIHKLLVDGYTNLASGFGDIAKASENMDLALANSGQDKVAKSQKTLEEFMSKAQDLAKKEGLSLTMNSLN